MKAAMKNRTVFPALALAVATTIVAGCGFRPLYGTQGVHNQSVQADMSGVAIQPISNRSGQLLRNRLLDKMTPAGQPTAPTYQLTVDLHESKVPLGIRKDETATRANMNQTATYILVDLTSHVIADRGSVQATTSYDIVNSDFGTISAERDARARGINILAEEITLRVALYFNRRGALTKKAGVDPTPAHVIQKK